MIDLSFLPSPVSAEGLLVLLVDRDGGMAASVPAGVRSVLDAAARTVCGKAGGIADVHVDWDGQPRRLALLALGDTPSPEQAGGALVAHFEHADVARLSVDLSSIPAGERAAFAVGLAQAAMLRSWRHDRYRTRDGHPPRSALTAMDLVLGEEAEAALALWPAAGAMVEGVAFARDLVSEPGNVLYPESFVERCRALEALGVEIEVLDEAAMRDLGMGALLAVSQGSAREARLLAMRWNGGGDGPLLAIVGKGVTFDTGGISIKPAAGMEAMKWDMAGAGAVAGLMKTLALRKAQANVVGLCALAENMPDGAALRPGDVVTSMSGQTIEVINTDAEGRLVLCDAITYAQHHYGARRIVDIATLTGAVVIALGEEFAGIFTPDEALAASLMAAGERAGERLWRMPLGTGFDRLIDSTIADVKNAGPREAGASTAARFLGRFIEDGVAWAHLDIAGVAWAGAAGPLGNAGATGFGVRLLDTWIGKGIGPLLTTSGRLPQDRPRRQLPNVIENISGKRLEAPEPAPET